ncbi:hypothetical protein TcWFU_009593 [Taenia crassiceps]|uniref:Uncharacterized protein n=1 Tax=Taenia crassiceps TaxID=6207 RepID=A0ABR4Q4I4_9CEST
MRALARGWTSGHFEGGSGVSEGTRPSISATSGEEKPYREQRAPTAFHKSIVSSPRPLSTLIASSVPELTTTDDAHNESKTLALELRDDEEEDQALNHFNAKFNEACVGA